MKKFSILLVAFFTLTAHSMANCDAILTKQRIQIPCVVVNTTDSLIFYYTYPVEDSTILSISVNDIAKVYLQTGKVYDYTKSTSPTIDTIQQHANSSGETKAVKVKIIDPMPVMDVKVAQEPKQEQEEQSIGIGRIYTFEDGSKGVIFYTDGEHGLVVSMGETKGSWCDRKFQKKDIYELTNQCDEGPEKLQFGEGAPFSQAIYNTTHSPIVAWCYSLGKGWYLPSANELHHLFYYANDSKDHGGLISVSLRKNGGKALQKGWYWSSSECKREEAVNVSENGDTATELKKVKNLVRAIRAF